MLAAIASLRYPESMTKYFHQGILATLVIFAFVIGCTPNEPGTNANANYVGGSLELSRAKFIAHQASQDLPTKTSSDKKFRAAFSETIVDLLAHNDPAQRAIAAEQLGELRKPQGHEALLLGIEDENSTVREKSIQAVGCIGDKKTALRVAAALTDKSIAIRIAAAEALGRLRNPQTMAALIEGLKDSDSQVRAASATSLGQMRDKSATEDLIIALRNDSAPSVRTAAAGALGLIKDPRSISPLVDALKDSDALVRYQVIGALEVIGDPKTISPLSALLKDPDVTIQRRAKLAITHLQN